METVNYNNDVNVDDFSDAETIHYTNKYPPKKQNNIVQYIILLKEAASNKQKSIKKTRTQEDNVVFIKKIPPKITADGICPCSL